MLRTYVTPDKPFHTTDVQKEKSLKDCTLMLFISWDLHQYRLKALVFTTNLCLHKNVFDSLMLMIPSRFPQTQFGQDLRSSQAWTPQY